MQNPATIQQEIHNTESRSRDYALDNIRFLLIFLVVFAHLLEVCDVFPGSRLLYEVIYTFHIPAFIFLFGYNIKFSPERIIFRWCIPYFVFQSIYILFSNFVLKINVNLQYITPYWLLWYMLVCIFYQLLCPLYDTEDWRKQVLALVCAVAIGLLAGVVNVIGYHLSLSRFFVFQPWFLLGFYCKKNQGLAWISVRKKECSSMVWISLVVIILSFLFLYYQEIPNGLLYGSFSYSHCGGSLQLRIGTYFIALCWIIFLFWGLKPYLNRKIFLITKIGQNTLPVFLLHGFIVKVVSVYGAEFFGSFWSVILLSCVIPVLLGNQWAQKIVHGIGFAWLEKLFSQDD